MTRIALDRLPVLTAALVYYTSFTVIIVAGQTSSLPFPSSSSRAADDRSSGAGGNPCGCIFAARTG